MKQIKKGIVVVSILLASIFALTAEEKKSGAGMNFFVGSDIGMAVCNYSSEGFGGFLTGVEIVPYVGCRPVAKIPELSFEFDFQMDFLSYEQSGDGATAKLSATFVTPQFLVGYEYDIGAFKPFIKIGTGVNFNSAKTEYSARGYSATETLSIDPSISFVANFGAIYHFNDKFSIHGAGRANFNHPNVPDFHGKIFMGTEAFDLGAEFRF